MTTPDPITTAVLTQMAGTPDPRLREIMEAAVRHLHAFAAEVRLTPQEWLTGIEFMTAVGRMCTPDRQEFILLSDTLGLSALVNEMHDRTHSGNTTRTSLLGPFFRENAPRLTNGAALTDRIGPNEQIVLWGHVTDTDGEPIAGAEIAIWQTGVDGLYDVQVDERGTDCRGVFTTDGLGRYFLRTAVPLGYSIPLDGPVGQLVKTQGRHGMRPAHIHVLAAAPGFDELVTALYLAGDPHISDDVVFGASNDLVAAIAEADPACPVADSPSLRFDLRLAPASATPAKGSGRVGADPASLIGPAKP